MSATGALNEFVSHCRDLGGNGVGKRENEKFGILNFILLRVSRGAGSQFLMSTACHVP